MKPFLPKTVRECSVAAHAIFEARVVVAGHTGRVKTSPLDSKLHELEKSYWLRADEIARELSAKKSPPKARRAGKKTKERKTR